MSIFTAGCIELTNNSQKIRDSVYQLAKYDLDSPSMKISVRKSPTCINFIAFLPKDKIKYENILKQVSECQNRSVLIFELDYKLVGVVCQEQKIVDYILDNPTEYAFEHNYETYMIDNTNGVELVYFNLDENSRRTKAGFISLGFTVLLTSTIFYSGYEYMQNIHINKQTKESLTNEYKQIVKTEFEKSSGYIHKKIDISLALEDIERLTQATNATLSQVKLKDRTLCVEVKTFQIEPFVSNLPKNIEIDYSKRINGIVRYCYETL